MSFKGRRAKLTLADLFDGAQSLVIYHFMLGPGWAEGCPSCSYISDHFDGMAVHLANRDVTLVVVRMRRLRRSRHSKSAWDGGSVGLVVRQRFQLRLSGVGFTKEASEGNAYYNYERRFSRARNAPD